MRVAKVSRRGAERWTRRQHPWIYRSDVIATPDGAAGDVAVVDDRGILIGMALWSPVSTIALRMLTHDERAIDGVFWRDRIAAAAAYRAELRPDATAYRIVHAEADGLPSFIADRYGDHVVVQLLSAGLEAHRDAIVGALVDVLRPAGILGRNDVPVRQHERLARENELLHGAVPEQLEVEEAGLRYIAAPWHGQKTGAFLDQRENRVEAGRLAAGRARVLDCFSYHGSFALHLARGAAAVTAVDSSAEAIARARENVELNGFDNVRFEVANVFELLRAQEASGERYDVIVLDPPAFAKRRDSVEGALRGYKDINLRALRLLVPGGVLCTFSCSYHVDRPSFRAMLTDAAADAGRPVRWLDSRGQSSDHPEILQIAESGYLKGEILQVA
jgi:23S rRNA (cytosine1962-C5)-methyltransferase